MVSTEPAAVHLSISNNAQLYVSLTFTFGLSIRLANLSRYRELAPTVEVIRQIAVERGLTENRYLVDWEVRARIAEAEIVALSIETNALPQKIDTFTGQYRKWKGYQGSRARIEKEKVYCSWLTWYAGRRVPPEHGDVARFLEIMEKDFPDIDRKTIEAWHAVWQKIERRG